MRQGVFVLSDLNADLRDADTDLIEEPQQSVVIYHICGRRSLFNLSWKRPEQEAQTLKQTRWPSYVVS